MKKLGKLFSGFLVFGMLLASPLIVDANHGGSNWETHYAYYQCVHGAGYFKFEDQHRHIGNTQEFRTISEQVSTYCPE